MTLFDVNIEELRAQANSYKEKSLLLSAEREHANAKVQIIKDSISDVGTKHAATVEELIAFKTKITALLGQAITDVSTTGAALEEARKNDESAKAAYKEAKKRSADFNPGDDASDDEKLKDKSYRDAKNAAQKLATNNAEAFTKAQTANNKAKTAVTELNGVLAKADAEIEKTNVLFNAGIDMLTKLSQYESTSLAMIGVGFRSLNLGDKLITFAGNVEAGDANAATNLNNNLPNRDWFNSKEGKDTVDFFNSKDPAIRLLLDEGAAETKRVSEILFAAANPSILEAEAADNERLKNFVSSCAVVDSEGISVDEDGNRIDKKTGEKVDEGYVSLLGDGSYAFSTLKRAGGNFVDTGDSFGQIFQGLARAGWTGVLSPAKQIVTGVVGLDAHQIGRGVLQIQNLPQGLLSSVEGAGKFVWYGGKTVFDVSSIPLAATGDLVRGVYNGGYDIYRGVGDGAEWVGDKGGDAIEWVGDGLESIGGWFNN